ncbi:MAG: HPr family phosphocarrier protein [Eubacteriales bacterium]
MYSKTVIVVNQVGLYAKAATSFVQNKANEFKSTVWIEKDERRVNAKSLLGILSMGLTRDSEMTILAEGKDEQEAVNALCDLVASGFSEQ